MSTSSEIIPYSEELHDALLSIWERGAKRTHNFLKDEDYAFYRQIVDREALPGMEVWAAVDSRRQPVGFVGLNGAHIEMLFVDPDRQRMGVGSALLDFAVKEKGCITVNVNEQNLEGRKFYQKYGFVEGRRLATDDRGKPYPLIRLELADCAEKQRAVNSSGINH
ncbi:MAG: GNAT family N-acetyltransferase [Desulfovibrionaceae bacterium]|nr:GNAT family N-acetyltransferase [Desulfovibrionaceae bacterium]